MSLEARGRERFERFERFLVVISRVLTNLPAPVRMFVIRFTRNVPGLLGIGLRYSALASVAQSMGRNVRIAEGVYILAPAGLSLGHNVSIHPMCYVDASGGVQLADDVSIAHGVTVMSTTHRFELGAVTRDLPVEFAPTSIGTNVWIGAGSRILAGVTINDNAVVGAGSVVTRDVAKGSVVAGVPARRIG